MCFINRARVALLALMLVAPSQSSAQVLRSFEDLALRVNLGDQLQVEDQSGAKVSGRLTRLTRDEMAIQTDVGERRFTRDSARSVAVRRYPLGKGALIGAGVVSVLGAVATCSHEGDGGCAIVGLLGGAPIGAGLGLAFGAVIPRMQPVYRAPEAPVSLEAPRAAGSVQPGLLEDLALRVNLNDRLVVEDASGAMTTGRLTGLTAAEVTLQSAGEETRFTREALRQVAVRHRPLRQGVIIGAVAGAATGAVAACTGEDRSECADASIMAGALGAGLGLAVGALMHSTTVVYPEPVKQTFVGPAISRDGVGIVVSRRW